MVEIDCFARLGSMLRFSTFIEDTIDGTSSPADLTCWDGYDEEKEQWTELIFHLERGGLYLKNQEILIKLFKSDRRFEP